MDPQLGSSFDRQAFFEAIEVNAVDAWTLFDSLDADGDHLVSYEERWKVSSESAAKVVFWFGEIHASNKKGGGGQNSGDWLQRESSC